MRSSKTLEPMDDLMDAERILINPLNHSTAKQQYSFSRAERWHRCKTQHDNYKFYELPTTKSKIATTIGNSKRNVLHDSEKQPAPNQYQYALDG